MTTLIRIIIAFILALVTSSCGFDGNFGNGIKGNGEITTDSRATSSEFTIVSASEGIDVYVTQGKTASIKVEADENVIALIATDITNGKLEIHAKENIGRATKKVYVTLPRITGIESASGADLISENTLKVDVISIDASSGSDISLEIMADEINVGTSSGADIKISGKTNILRVDASSGSDIQATHLESKICHAEASSGSDISVTVSDKLVADASSGADIRYSGNPEVQKNKSPSGSVRKR